MSEIRRACLLCYPAAVTNSPIRATCVDARGDARRIFWSGGARRRVLPCGRPHLRPFTCRGPGWSSRIRSNSKRRARGALLHTGFPDPVSSTVAPSLSFDLPPPQQPHRRERLHAHGRSSVDPTFGHQGPDHAGHLVGQCYPHQHRRLAGQHARQPRSGWCAMTGRPAQDSTRPDDQQAT